MDQDGLTGACGIRVVCREDEDYPAWLRRIYEPPPLLWAAGRLRAEEGAFSVAVVGARAATPRGLAFARMLASELAAAGLTVVSGLARGIDTAAHQGALEAGGRTVAVLGCGLDQVYPKENAALARRIAQEGAVVSEFPPGTGPWKQNFPRRNRTIAGWARATVVVEAGVKSGALHTARAALEEGREVMAVPGHPSEPNAGGTNALLRDGAGLVRDAADVLAELGLPAPARPAPAAEDEVLRAVRRGSAAAVDEIAGRCRLALPELLARLSELELSGVVRRLPGGLFVRS
ncbi:MAG TPA: DNA-processing protein DprA [Vicinamibacteria bacterium]|nr:DNA-processing protein DprA [Vicinamibacteria bacterium]